jgi:hypothetical protein
MSCSKTSPSAGASRTSAWSPLRATSKSVARSVCSTWAAVPDATSCTWPAEAIGAGTWAVGEYDQERMDAALGVDGVDEFTIYMAPVGKVPA